MSEEKKAYTLYEEISSIPRVTGGKITKSSSKPIISLKYSQQDVRDNGTTHFQKTFISELKEPIQSFLPNDHYLHSQSPSGKLNLYFKEIKADPKKNRIDETRIELWTNEGKIFSLGCKEFHGKACTVDDFQRVFIRF
jgi:hypothetical protein